jgi:hypothetical protein
MPTTITITWSGGTVNVAIPPSSNYSDYMQAIVRGGGVWTNNVTSGVLTFIPVSEFTEATAQ